MAATVSDKYLHRDRDLWHPEYLTRTSIETEATQRYVDSQTLQKNLSRRGLRLGLVRGESARARLVIHLFSA